jgi:pilus assembly protein CpaC
MTFLRKIILPMILLLAVSAAAGAFGQTTMEAAQPANTTVAASSPSSQPAEAADQQTSNTTSVQQAQEPSQESPAPLRVMVDKSILINTAERLKRVSITDPAVADAVVVTPNQLMIHGRAPGEVTLVVWDEQERSRSFDLRVDVDITAAAEQIKQLMPDQQINVSASRNALILSGHVVDKEMADHAGAIAGAYSKNVINVLTFGPVGTQEVLLEVRFAEVDRTALTQFATNIFSSGASNTIGTVTTGQFGSIGNFNLTNQIGAPATGFTTNLPAVNPLNLFVFRPDLNLGAALQALQQKNLLQILAEPNLIAVNGREASFLAGGEFPVPVPQPGSGTTIITIQFKEFGIRLNFTPVIMPNGNIYLSVKPEVSALDFPDGIQISGFRVPALTTRRFGTELELKDGQSFLIAGLMDNRVTQNMSKIPGIGDIPILGAFFRSKDLNRTKTELMVLVTAHRVSPTDQKQPGPGMPKPFLDKDKFDKSRDVQRTFP